MFAALLVYRAPDRGRYVLFVMIFMNAIWALTDLVYIPLFALTAVDFSAKLIVNAGLALSIAITARRAGLV